MHQGEFAVKSNALVSLFYMELLKLQSVFLFSQVYKHRFM